MATKDRPGTGGIFEEGYFTEGIGKPGFGGITPKIAGASASTGNIKQIKENVKDVKKDLLLGWQSFMKSLGYKSDFAGNPSFWHNTKGNPIPGILKNIKNPKLKEQGKNLYYNYLRADGVIPGKFQYRTNYTAPLSTTPSTITTNPYKKFDIKTKKPSSGKNTQTVVNPNVILGDKATLNERLFYNPKVRKYFIDKTGSVLHRTHPNKSPNRTLEVVKNPRLKEKLDQPSGLNTQVRNSLQNKMEDKIISLENKKLSILNNTNLKKINLSKWKKEINKIDDQLNLVKNDANKLGLDIQLINPATGKLKQYSSGNFSSLKNLADSLTKDIKLESITYGGTNILPAGKKDGGYADGSQPTNSVETFQTFFEEGVGDKEASLRTLGTLWNGKLLTAPSSGFGGEYAAENLPILKDMDPLSRGIWNTIAPYGEKAFDILDTAFRLPGAFVADTAEGLGVSEDEANKLQAELNTMLFMPVAGGPVSNAGRIKNAQNSVNNVKKVKNEIVDSSKKVEATIIPKEKPLPVKKVDPWEGLDNYKSEKKTSTKPWIINFPGQTNTMSFKTRKDAQLYIDKNYSDPTIIPENLPTITKQQAQAGEKTGEFSRYSIMFDDIKETYNPTDTQTATQWYGQLKNRGHAQELDKTGFGYALFKQGDNKLTAADLFTLRKNTGTQIKTDPIRMNKKSDLDLRAEFDTITNEYNDFLVNGTGFVNRGTLPPNVSKFIQTKVDNFQKYYNRVLDNTDGRLNARQEAILNDKIDKVLAEITLAAEKAQGGNAWGPMLRDIDAPNFSLNVYQASSDVLTKTQVGSAARRFLNNLKNIRENFGTTSSHADYTLPGNTARKTHKVDVYTYNPLKGQVNTKDVGSTHMGQNNELAHVRKTERKSTDGQNGIFLDEMQFDTLRNVAKSDKPVFKPEIHANQAEALTNQLNSLESQKNRIFNSELKKLLIKSDVDDATDYNLPQNQRALMERVKEISDNDPNLTQVKEKILADFGTMDNFMAQQNNKAYGKIDKEVKRINSEFKNTPTQTNSMPDIPFRQQTEMIKEILKKEIELAIKGNKDFIAIPSPEVVMGYEQGSGTNLAIAFDNIYRKRSLEAIRSIQDDYIKRLDKLGIDSKPFSIRAGDDVDMFIAWDRGDNGNQQFMGKMEKIYEQFNLNDPKILEMIASGNYKEPLRPINYGSMPGGRNAIQPGIVIDLRNLKGFDRKLLAKIGFQEYKEGGKTDINKYSALAEIDILGVAV